MARHSTKKFKEIQFFRQRAYSGYLGQLTFRQAVFFINLFGFILALARFFPLQTLVGFLVASFALVVMPLK